MITTATPEQIAAAYKDRFAKNGFDPEDMLAWYERTRNGTPVTLREFLQKVLGEARRRGWLAEANLDYEPQPVEKKGDIPLAPDCNWDIKVWPNFGSSEGIYIDWVYEGRYPNETIMKYPAAYDSHAERIDRDDPSKGYVVTYRLHCGKTLDEDLGGMERMSLLCGRLLWLIRAIPV